MLDPGVRQREDGLSFDDQAREESNPVVDLLPSFVVHRVRPVPRDDSDCHFGVARADRVRERFADHSLSVVPVGRAPVKLRDPVVRQPFAELTEQQLPE